jgi:hypothetical protein
MKVECSKDQLPLLGGRQDEKYAGKIERHQDSKRDLQKGSRVISQQGNEHSLPQDSRTGSQQGNGHSLPQDSRTGSQQGNGHSLPQDSRTGSQQENEYSLPQESRITEKRHRLQDQEINKRKGSPKKTKPECLEDDRQGPRNLQRYKLTVKQDNQLGKLERLSVLKDEKMINKRDKDLLIFTYQQTLVYRDFKT